MIFNSSVRCNLGKGKEEGIKSMCHKPVLPRTKLNLSDNLYGTGSKSPDLTNAEGTRHENILLH